MAKNVCNIGCCPACLNSSILLLGVLILLNAYYAWFTWAVFVGGIIAIKGLVGLIMPTCPHCK